MEQIIVGTDGSGDVEQRIIQVEAGNAQLQHLFPFGIDGDLELNLILDSRGLQGLNDADNGFSFEVIIIVEAPSGSSVILTS